MVWNLVVKKKVDTKKIAVLVVYDDNYESMKEITVDNNISNYCDLHGYTLITRKINSTEREPQWYKISESIDVLKSNDFDWVFFIDLDCLIMNPTIKLETLIDEKFSFLVPSHAIPAIDNPITTPFNTDNIITSQFLVKTDEFGIKILEDIWNATELSQDLNTFDYEGRQTRITISKPEFKPYVKIIEEKLLNRFWFVNSPFIVYNNIGVNDLVWQPGDFIAHVTSYKKEDRNKLLDELNYFSGGEIINVNSIDEKIYFSTFSHLPYVKLKLKDLDGNLLSEYELKDLKPKHKFYIILPKNNLGNSIRLEGYNKINNLISLHKLEI